MNFIRIMLGEFFIFQATVLELGVLFRGMGIGNKKVKCNVSAQYLQYER